MAINNVSEGQTFKDWLDATNQVINTINAASPVAAANRLVRYSSSGALEIGTFATGSLALESGFTVNNISNTVTADNYTLVTAAGIQEYLSASADNIISAGGVVKIQALDNGVYLTSNNGANSSDISF